MEAEAEFILRVAALQEQLERNCVSKGQEEDWRHTVNMLTVPAAESVLTSWTLFPPFWLGVWGNFLYDVRDFENAATV